MGSYVLAKKISIAQGDILQKIKNIQMQKIHQHLLNLRLYFFCSCIVALMFSHHLYAGDYYILMTSSLRLNSLNKQLIEHIGYSLKQKKISYNIINLADYQQPAYNPDLANSESETIMKLRQEIINAKALIIASPEYNRSLPGAFKNIIDWLSVGQPSCFKKKPIWLLTTSPSVMGLTELDKILSYLGGYVYPKEFCLINGKNKNPKKTALNIDFKQQQHLEKSLQEFIFFTDKLNVIKE